MPTLTGATYPLSASVCSLFLHRGLLSFKFCDFEIQTAQQMTPVSVSQPAAQPSFNPATSKPPPPPPPPPASSAPAAPSPPLPPSHQATMQTSRRRGRSAAPAGPPLDEPAALDSIRRHAITAVNRPELNRRILDAIPATARFVLIGEASHGTKEFYDRRFPRWMWHNRSVEKFVEWLRNHNLNVVRPGADSSKDVIAAARRCGFYGMDVYSLHSSADAVLGYLRQTDPQAARVVEARYRCFDRYGADAQSYGLATSIFHKASCEESVNRALYDIRRRVESYRAAPDGPASQEDALAVEANAMVVSGAEAYYRNMFTRDEITWNLRDTHFFNTTQLVEKHLARLQQAAAAEAAAEADGGTAAATPPQPKMVLWAHNSHLGDARYTDAGWRRSQLNIGQLVRQEYGDQAVSIGFTTHTGRVTAADEWGEAARHMKVRPSLPGSYEHLMHAAVFGSSSSGGGGGGGGRGGGGGGGGGGRKEHQCQDQHQEGGGGGGGGMGGGLPPVFALNLRNEELAERLQGPLLERAIGVIYRPDTELQSHYFEAVLPRQFNILIHEDATRAVVPIEPGDEWALDTGLEVTHGDMPELWPSGV
ncbi:hypothetical protein VOLCADRAFT_89045 [Volvox carteri f. nagariensis]|uniref:Erythromycin esterase n=1 Tax=Volvox carteri f. nagariensis TaxID=3068 RepID=D8TQN0_VOLCA|nr:uncharacterized protein VOLCADRAFT_89045 [Volvox carteri f. nagariensis]EFJ50181.1 hypothetical protein VOLCADRAFT_89045 [Volvox carteri f. nagariensis]|eukprot:XP_002948801.1 hypothetical protein VOLCADRAFT_89045 [Volvox carteri f. nagariensis]